MSRLPIGDPSKLRAIMEKASGRKDRISGGLADKKKRSDFDEKALQAGIEIELEHTDDRALAAEIAMDHLTEDPAYYRKLKMVEKSLSKAAGGWQSIPGGKRGGQRKRVGMKWRYRYPDGFGGWRSSPRATPKKGQGGIQERLKQHKEQKRQAAVEAYKEQWEKDRKEAASKQLQQTLENFKSPLAGMEEQLDFGRAQERAAGMGTVQLKGAIKQLIEALPDADAMDREMGTTRGGRYRDEISVYRQELAKRKDKPNQGIKPKLKLGGMDVRAKKLFDSGNLEGLKKLFEKVQNARWNDPDNNYWESSSLRGRVDEEAKRHQENRRYADRLEQLAGDIREYARLLEKDTQKSMRYTVPLQRFTVPKAGKGFEAPEALAKAGGWGPIPKGRHGGQRKPDGRGGYVYRYPDGRGGWQSSPRKRGKKKAVAKEQIGFDFEAAAEKAEDERAETPAGTLSEIIRVAGAALKIGDLLRPFGDNSFRILNIERKGPKLQLTTLHVQEAKEVVLEVKPTDQIWAQVASAEPSPTYPEDSPPENTPRSEAKKASKKARKESEYVNDRVSRVEQRGEDVGGSARHRAMEWKSMREALTSEHAEKMFTRDFLTRQEPIDFIGRVQSDENFGTDSLAQLFLYFCQNKIPTKPLKKPDLREWYIRGGGKDRADTWATSGYMTALNRGKEWREMSDADKKKHEEQYVKQLREQYYTAFTKVREVLEKHSRNPDPNPMNLWRDVSRDLYEQYSSANGMFELAVLKKVRKAINGRGQTAPIRAANEVVKRVKQEHPDFDAQKSNLREVMLKILEGKSVPAAFGEKGKGKQRFDVAQFYDTNKMIRKGPPSRYKGVEQGLDLLDKKSGRSVFEMHHIQWGKTVTDYEREHHLKSLVDSFDDLAEVTGLPPAMAGYNGKLTIAVGARGTGGALAHYENDTRAINLTRKKGAGSLAHEWGHFFDYQVGLAEDRAGFSNTGGEAMSEREEWRSTTQRNNYEGTPVTQAVLSLKSSDGWIAFSKRLNQVVKDHPLIGEDQAVYWESNKEKFARCFERHVQRKLHKQGRENTYLVAVRKAANNANGLWPTDEEVDAMAPLFEKIFEKFKESGLMEKMLRWWAEEDQLRKARYTVPKQRFVVGAG